MMSTVIRVNKNKNYTVLSNHHIRDRKLTLKAKGLLSLMLSLPDDWEYSVKGLAAISREGIDGIGATLSELEHNSYVTRKRLRNKQRRLKDVVYEIFEQPPKRENPILDSRVSAYELVHSSDFPVINCGSRLKISKKDFAEWLDKQSACNW